MDILRSAKTILLVDWPDQRVPRTLLNTGFDVIGFSPGRYSRAELIDRLAEGQRGFAPRNGSEHGYLVFNKIEGAPGPVDIVCVYRPEAEHEAIIEKHVLPLKAKALWLQPPVSSAKTAAIAVATGLIFMENADLAECALLLK